MSDVQTNEPTQTQIDNQNVKTDDDASKYSSTTLQTDNQKVDQTTTSNESTRDNPSTIDSKATTTKSTKDATTSEPSSDLKHDTSTTQKPDSDTNNSVTATVAQETSSAPDLETSAADKQALHTEVQQTNTTKPSTSEIPDSDANKKSLPNEVQPDNTTKPSEAQIPESDSNKQSSPTEVPPLNTATPSASQISDTDANRQSLPNEVQPDNSTKPSETQIPESDANKQPSPTEVPSVNTTTPSASQIPETDANKQSPPTKVQPINTQGTSTTQDTSTTEDPDSSANKQPLPTEIQKASVDDSSTHQLPDSGTNKPATEDKSPIQTNVVQERKQLQNLIDQELKFIETICPKLGQHQEHIKKERDDAFKKFKTFDDFCDIKELKDLKKTVTKLKLQIPAKYRTLTEKRKKQQSDADKKDDIPSKLLKKLPRLHHELFSKSQICKTIQKRYSELPTRELKICLLCFSVFPENEIISRRLMVYWWIGEGLTPADEDLKEGNTAEDHANGIFNELMDRDFIQPVSKNHGRNVAACKMHPMVRAALIIIADEIRFFDFDKYGDPKDFGKFDEIDSPEEIPIIHPLGDPREFFDFYQFSDGKPKETNEEIEFTQNGNPTMFAPYPQNNKESDDKEPLVVDSNGKEIDKTKKFYFYRRKKITTRSYKVCLMGSGLSKGIKWDKLHVLFNVMDDILEF